MKTEREKAHEELEHALNAIDDWRAQPNRDCVILMNLVRRSRAAFDAYVFTRETLELLNVSGLDARMPLTRRLAPVILDCICIKRGIE